MGAPAKAEPLYSRALSMQTETFGEGDESLIDTLSDQGSMYQELEKYGDAVTSFEKALAICKTVGASADDMKVKVLSRLEDCYRQDNNLDRAIEINQEGRTLIEKQESPDQKLLSDKLNDLALLYKQKEDFANSEKYLKEAMSVIEKAYGRDSKENSIFMNNLARLYSENDMPDKAADLYKSVIDIRSKVFGARSLPVAAAMRNYASVLRDLNQVDDAKKLNREAASIEKGVQQ
ncbi:MAG: tetratricopeptide repeat protein [Candidatus Melainabacteria bacterium]|nr:tetratricopeptide repeat protein [Candidatus Melainabacteria bacterium]